MPPNVKVQGKQLLAQLHPGAPEVHWNPSLCSPFLLRWSFYEEISLFPGLHSDTKQLQREENFVPKNSSKKSLENQPLSLSVTVPEKGRRGAGQAVATCPCTCGMAEA